MRKKLPHEQRRLIVEQPTRRPYGALIRVHVQNAAAFGLVEEIGILFSAGTFALLAPTRSAPSEGGRKYALRLEGFPTAASAEAAGRRLVQALLWMAVTTDVALRLDYRSYEPAAVFDRTRSEGIQSGGHGEVYYQPNAIFGEIKGAYDDLPEPDAGLLLSMEIFTGAQLEASDRARFLATVSALEPLATRQPLGVEVNRLVDTCIETLEGSHRISVDVRRSLDGRLRQLSMESVGQAIRRVIRATLPNRPDAVAVVDAAYALRSQIVHGGRPADLDVDLEQESRYPVYNS